MDLFANYPHIESLFVRLARYKVHIEEMYIGFHGMGTGYNYSKSTSLEQTPNREYGDPLDEHNGWCLKALVYISWPRSRARAPLLPKTWRMRPGDRLYKEHTGIWKAPHPFIVKAYSHKDGIEALYNMLTSLANELEEFDAEHCTKA